MTVPNRSKVAEEEAAGRHINRTRPELLYLTMIMMIYLLTAVG